MRNDKTVVFELEESMAQLLDSSAMQETRSKGSTADAVINLVKAAEIFENLGMNVAAEAVTRLLENMPLTKKTASVYRITTRHADGEHELADGVKTYEEAKATAERWLGGANYWENGDNKNPARPMRAITNDGGVLLIEERPTQLSPFAENVWKAVQYSWLVHEDDLFERANEQTSVNPERPLYDPNNPNEPKDPYLYELLGGASKEDIKKAFDELLEGGFITGKQLEVDRKAEQKRKEQERARKDPEWAKHWGIEID